MMLPAPAAATPDAAEARRIFAEAEAICRRDAGRFWGRSLCGPIMLVDWRDRGVVANVADANKALKSADGLFTGTLPPSVIIANTPTDWSGTRWTQLVMPVEGDRAQRHVLLAHELFHRIQRGLKLTRPEQANHHLDTFVGRYLLQLEWRALARALPARGAARSAAIRDALMFRDARYRRFPDAAAEEAALEMNEGTAEYTGVMLGLRTDAERVAYAIRDLAAFVAAPTFVRSFAYATGPAYGLLLDRANPGWRKRFGAGERFDQLLAAAVTERPVTGSWDQRVASYDDGTLRRAEEAREHERVERLAGFTAALVDGPVLMLPLAKTNFQFNPQTLVAMPGVGTIYPTARLTDDWGSLEVERGGALVRKAPRQATVSARGISATRTSGDGWKLALAPGWTIVPGERAGDFVIRASVKADRLKAAAKQTK